VAPGRYLLAAIAYDDAGASAQSSVTVTVASPPSGVVSAYALNEGAGSVAVDSSGHGLTGTIAGATWTAGRYGQGLRLAGNGAVAFGDLDLAGSFTVMAWLQTRTLYASTCGSFVMKRRDYGFELCGGRFMGRPRGLRHGRPRLERRPAPVRHVGRGRRVLGWADRRGADLQPRAHAGRHPERHEHANRGWHE
jgi:hypothetical protein